MHQRGGGGSNSIRAQTQSAAAAAAAAASERSSDLSHIDMEDLLGKTVSDGMDLSLDLPAESVSFTATGTKISGPRNYQHELMMLAKTENVIAFLETGSGKTFIAVMLMKELVIPRALAYSKMIAEEEEGASQIGTGVVRDRTKMQEQLDARMKLGVAARKGKGLSLARLEHMSQFGSAQEGFVVSLENQVAKVVRSMISLIARGDVEPNLFWEPPRSSEEASQICSDAVAHGIIDVLGIDPMAKDQDELPAGAGDGGASETSDNLRLMEHRMVAFLVPRVPLVFQQAEVIRLNTELDVGEYCGEHNSDHFNVKAWEEEFNNRDVLVMTPQILLNILRHGFLSISKFQLIIFDEAHHATQHHPYNLIMQEFYWPLAASERPRVFGMTASPVKKSAFSGRESHVQAIMHLESNLGCRVVTVSKNSQEEVNKHAPKPQEAELEHQPPPMDNFQYATFPATAKRLISTLMKRNPMLGADAFFERQRGRAARYEGEGEDGSDEEESAGADADAGAGAGAGAGVGTASGCRKLGFQRRLLLPTAQPAATLRLGRGRSPRAPLPLFLLLFLLVSQLAR
jgi:hypothetical protein